MVVAEFLPLLAARGLATDRIGLLGWSMGSYGTLHLAQTLGAARVAGAVAESRLSPRPAGGIEPGAHNATFWRSQAAAQLAFVGGHLARR